ncbi:NADH dehydrogenase-like protein [Coniochaeta hoffmannii]|uniref:NADH dehydrogenase-like protein n=1 Tax=Coniochaeta hoffmannii TaxID=91930 RepID=A0AA38S1B8_9PEZI|nr:NADH dehydrogenase-like protein [Coniochaeta hoffmannii]
MRYNDWDVLLFPASEPNRYSKTPFKEFGVACQVIPDAEQAHCQGSLGLPIVTCFVPSVQPGSPFQVSIHSWSEPDITQFTKSYSKHIELVQFEARVFVDGQLVASSIFNRKNKVWPHIIDATLELSKSGELELLKFPAFKKELLSQSYWSPGDDTGRIKVVISEGFPRDSLTMPLERVKNVVAFSFQHAPLDVLEAKGIAWPNPSMWRIPASNFHPGEGPQSHAHSPRHQSIHQGFAGSSRRRIVQPSPSGFLSSMDFPPAPPTVPGPTVSGIGMAANSVNDMAFYNDLITPAPFPNDFTSKTMWPAPGFAGPGMTGSYSAMMQTDYMTQANSCPPFEGEPMHLSGPSLEDDEPISTDNLDTKVPTNTPTTGSIIDPRSSTASATFQPSSNSNSFMTPDFAHSLTHSLLNQPLPMQPQNIPPPASGIKSRKERDTRFLTFHGSNPASATSTPQGAHPDIRKFSQPLFNPAPGVFNNSSNTASTSPASPTFTSATSSRNASNTDSGPNVATAGSANTPGPLGNSSSASLNAAAVGSGRKRNRNFTPISAKAIDDEDQPLRPSPHMRASYNMVDGESDA